MSFESGAVGFRAFYVPRGLPEDALARFADDAAPPIETLGTEEISGWVTGRHLLDRNVSEDTAYLAGRLRLCLMKAERRIPAPLLRAQCKIEELAAMQAQDRPFLKRHERAEIRNGVVDRLLPKMPPRLTGIPFVYDPAGKSFYAGAMSDKQVEALTLRFRATTGIGLITVNAATAAAKRKKVKTDDLEPTSFSPELEDPLAGSVIGHDFLTWLWFHSEARGGLLRTEAGEFAVAVEGPLTFFLEGDGAHVTFLRNGVPTVSTEAKTSLLSGKKLRAAHVILSRGDEMWTAMFDADGFVFRGLKIPKGEDLDAVSEFQRRMMSLDTFVEAYLSFYDRFLEQRCDKTEWRATQKDIHKWVADRAARR